MKARTGMSAERAYFRQNALSQRRRRARMMEAMMDTQLISEHLASLKQEIHDLREMDAQTYWGRNARTQEDKSAHIARQSRLVQIKQDLWGMMERAATSREYSAPSHRQ